MFPLVSATLFLPLAGAVLLLLRRGSPPRLAHAVGIVASGLTLLGSLFVWTRGSAGEGFSQVEEVAWMPSLNAAYRVGVDGISLPLVLMTAVLFFVSLLFSAHIAERALSYVALFLLLGTASIGVFVALDAVLFYVFFEVTLVGMYFVIAGWGYEGRQRAALTFFLYTLLGSLPLLLAIIALYLGSEPNTFDMRELIASPPLAGLAATLTLIAMLVTFFVKIAVFPVHTWLPAAHVEAPTAGSVILAGVLLKLGTYGLGRFALPMTPHAFRALAPLVVVFGGFSALDGAVLQMVSHGIVTGALFLLVGMLQERAHTREMGQFVGLLRLVPALGWAFVLAAFASLGLPGLAHFPAEFQIFLGTFYVYPAAVIAALGIVVTAGLYLRAIQIAFLGEPKGEWTGMKDLNGREVLAAAPLLALAVLIGVAPLLLLDVIHATTEALLL